MVAKDKFAYSDEYLTCVSETCLSGKYLEKMGYVMEFSNPVV